MSCSATVSAALALLAFGCYASHEGGEERGCGDAGRESESCERSLSNRVLPLGVCRLADGSLLAFSDAHHSLSCDDAGAGIYALHAARCVPERPRRRETALCDASAADASALGLVEFVPGARPPWIPASYDGLGSRCAIADRRVAPNAEPWRPFVEADTICSDAYAWCGSPYVIELRQRGGDPCAGGRFTQRCAASIVDGTVVLRAETAEAVATSCLSAVGDRVARCVVPPLPAGRHDVTNDTGALLGVVEVPMEPPVGDDLTPTCARMP